ADGDPGQRLAAAVNDAMSEAHRAYPDRFVGCATLPMQDPARAVTELQRAAALPGIRGVYLGTNINGRELSDPSFTPIFAACEAKRLPVLLHPLTVIGAGNRLGRYYLNNFLGNPFDTAIAAAHLVFGGVLDRFPKLEVCLPHAGGALPYLMGRLTHGQRVRPETKGVAKKPFESYLRRFTYDTISHSPHLLRFLIDTVGADRVMLGSDYCFDMGYTRPVDIVTKSLVRLGLALIFQDLALLIGGGDPYSLPLPSWLQGVVTAGALRFPKYRIFIMAVAVVIGALLWLALDRTLVGAMIRAAVDDAEMAQGVGIRVPTVSLGVFALGALLAALGGGIGGGFLGVYPGLDFEILPYAFVVVIVGGLGSLPGAMVGSLLVGLLDNFGKALFPELSYFTLFAPMALILALKPTGLFGRV